MNRRRLFILSTITALGLASLPGAVFAQPVVKVGFGPFPSGLSRLPGVTENNYKSLDPNTAQGANIDLMNAVAKDAGLQIQYVAVVAGEKIGAVKAKTVDLLIGLGATDPAAGLLDFCPPIYVTGDALVVPRKDTRQYTSWEDLKGAVVGVLKGSAEDGPAQKSGLFKQVTVFDTPASLEKAVSTGRIQAQLDPNFIAVSYAFNPATGNPSSLALGLRVVETYKMRFPSPNSFAVVKGNAQLLAKLDASLAKLKANGTTQAIFAKYGIERALVN